MSQTLKRVLSYGILASLLVIVLAPVTFAQAVECDSDADGYISLPASGADVILGETFNVNGNYSAAEWASYFETFKNDPAAETLCSALNFKKGAEPSRCDKSLVSPSSGVYDPSMVETVQGKSVYPSAFDKPDNGIDENCDGEDGKLIEVEDVSNDNLGSLADRVVYMLSRAVVVVSVIVLIWGGIMYSTAAGDERKTSKARKAIIGAIIGLAIGLLAPSIAAYIIASLA